MSDWRKYYKPELRNLRYQKDKEYREKCRKRSREYYRSRKAKGGPTDQTLFQGADGVVYSTVGRVAMLIKRSPWTVRTYVNSGVIPTATYYGEANARRLYSPAQVDVIVEAFVLFDSHQLQSLAEVGEMIRKEFEDGDIEKVEPAKEAAG